MGLEVSFTAFIRGVHPRDFDAKLAEIERTISAIRTEIIFISLRDATEYVERFTELWDELEEVIALRTLIWQAQEAIDVEVGF